MTAYVSGKRTPACSSQVRLVSFRSGQVSWLPDFLADAFPQMGVICSGQLPAKRCKESE